MSILLSFLPLYKSDMNYYSYLNWISNLKFEFEESRKILIFKQKRKTSYFSVSNGENFYFILRLAILLIVKSRELIRNNCNCKHLVDYKYTVFYWVADCSATDSNMNYNYTERTSGRVNDHNCKRRIRFQDCRL